MMVISPEQTAFTIDVKGLYRPNAWAVKTIRLLGALGLAVVLMSPVMGTATAETTWVFLFPEGDRCVLAERAKAAGLPMSSPGEWVDALRNNGEGAGVETHVTRNEDGSIRTVRVSWGNSAMLFFTSMEACLAAKKLGEEEGVLASPDELH